MSYSHASAISARHVLPLALLLAPTFGGCSSPVRLSEPEWRDQLSDVAAPGAHRGAPVAASAPVAAPVVLPASLTGELLVKSSLRYELSRTSKSEAKAWTVQLSGPVRTTQSVDSWASVAISSDAVGAEQEIKQARVYSGRLRAAPLGEEGDESLVLMALAFTGRGLYRACESRQPNAYIGAFLTSFAASFTVQRSKEIRSIMRQVCQWDGSWVPFSEDPAVRFDLRVMEAERTDTEFGPGWTFPMEVLVGDVQGFHGMVTVVEPGGALGLTAGVVEVVGVAPHRPDDTVRLQLVGAKAPRADHLKPDAVERLLQVKPQAK